MTVLDDTIPELDESCLITIMSAESTSSNAGNAALNAFTLTSTITILENDHARGLFSIATDSRAQTGWCALLFLTHSSFRT